MSLYWGQVALKIVLFYLEFYFALFLQMFKHITLENKLKKMHLSFYLKLMVWWDHSICHCTYKNCSSLMLIIYYYKLIISSDIVTPNYNNYFIYLF